MRVIAALLVVVLWTPSAASADESPEFADADLTPLDWGIMGACVPIAIGFRLWEPGPYDRDPRAPGFDRWARDGLRIESPRSARRISDVLLYTEIGGALLLPSLIELRGDGDVLNATALGVQSLLLTYTVLGMVKDFVRRERPDADRDEHQAFASFYSGHTAMSFASATMIAAYAERFDWGGDASLAIGALAFAAAGVTGYLRVATNRHWLSDVVVGALVGTATSLTVLALHPP